MIPDYRPICASRAFVSRAKCSAALLRRAERDPGPSARRAKRNIFGPLAVWPLGPGSRRRRRRLRPGHAVAGFEAIRRRLQNGLDTLSHCAYLWPYPCSSRGASGGDPEGGARSGVPRLTARNRRLGRSGTPPARHYDLAARSSLHGSGGNAGDGSAGPDRKSPRWSAERRARLRKGARHASQSVAMTHAPVGAPPPLDRGDE
jgi:hypothetical protein